VEKKDFDSQAYWERRLSSQIDLQGTGHRGFDSEYNRWFYLAQADSLDMLLKQNQIVLQNMSAIDIGSGVGFYIDFIKKRGATKIVGVDISQTSIDYLKNNFPDCDFYKADISDIDLKLPGKFDVLIAISILFHIVDDMKFAQAIQNIGNLVKPRGFAILSDTFSPPLFNPASHVTFRSRAEYENELKKAGFIILDTLPMFYFLNRTFIPIIGPRLLSLIKAGKLLYHIDTSLRNRRLWNWHGSKLLLAQKLDI